MSVEKEEMDENQKLLLQELKKRARRTTSITKSPNKLWSIMNGKQEEKNDFLNIEAIEEANSKQEMDSLNSTLVQSMSPTFNMRVSRRSHIPSQRTAGSLNKDLLEADIDFDKFTRKQQSHSSMRRVAKYGRNRPPQLKNLSHHKKYSSIPESQTCQEQPYSSTTTADSDTQQLSGSDSPQVSTPVEPLTSQSVDFTQM